MAGKFICNECNDKSIVISKSMELGPDDQSDERSLQAINCLNCDFQGIALYEESRRGKSESFRHYGYKVSNSVFDLMFEAINYNNRSINLDSLKKNSDCFPLKLGT